MKNWLVVANAARARVLQSTEHRGRCEHVADLVHPESRMKGIELASDSTRHGEGARAYQARTGPREHAHEQFAIEVAALLNAGVAEGRCAGLVLVASNPFLGHLKAHLGEQAAQHVLRAEPRDETARSDVELAADYLD